jgi:minor fimbrial subunit
MKNTFSALAVSAALLLSTNGAFAADSVTINVTGKVVASPCTVFNNGTNPLVVDIGQTIQATSLLSANSRTNPVNFDLPISGCPLGTNNISATFTGTQDGTTTTMWKNTAASPAANTAIELKQQTTGTTISNNSVVVAPVSAGAAVFHLSANAFSAAGNVTPGDINTSIVASFTYQ